MEANNHQTGFNTRVTTQAQEFFEKLADMLEIADSRYEEANRRYKSVGNWLCREGSTLKVANPVVHIQGSFALGTVIKPVTDDEDYDIDMVAELTVDTNVITQKQLKGALMNELSAYARAYSMETPEIHRRCVRLNYADDAQFHMDVTPAVPDGVRQTAILKSQNISNPWTQLAVSITDEKHWAYSIPTPNWPHSNPRGYLKWFHSRMETVFGQKRAALALQKRASVESIPDYKVRTPLQSSIQILKRHRDMTHEGDPADRPISIIITTLAAKAYNQETTVAAALYNILMRMENYIERKDGVVIILNPTDSRENFADKWKEKPEKERAFFAWLEKAKADFFAIATSVNYNDMAESLAPVIGARLADNLATVTRSKQPTTIGKLFSLNNPSHKQPLPWTPMQLGTVRIKTAEYKRKYGGFRWQQFRNGGQALPKECDLRFEASTDIPQPYQVYWQVVNNGKEAAAVNGLRGGFDTGQIDHGKLIRIENTRYRGSHTIECFIVKNGYCVGSGPFIVNIQ